MEIKMTPKQSEIYNAKGIKFKFPAEHHIGSTINTSEMQVTHEAVGGTQMILSFFLIDGDPLDVKENKFLEALFPELWKLEDDSKISLAEYTPNLNDIVHKGLQNFFRKDFYRYEGSLAFPPCEESIIHIIMATPIKVHKLLLDVLKKKTFNNEETDVNSRKPKPPSVFQKVTYH